jgi:hypothetical protein
LPWTLSLPTIEPQAPVRGATAEDRPKAAPTEIAAPVPEPVVAKVQPSAVAFIAEIESEPTQELIQQTPVAPPEPPVTRAATPLNTGETTQPQATPEAAARIQEQQGAEPQVQKLAKPAPAEPVVTAVEAQAPETREKPQPKQVVKSDALPAAEPAPEQDATAVQAIHKETRPSDRENPEPKAFTPAPAKKPEKGPAAPEAQPQAAALVACTPVRECTSEKVSDSAEVQPLIRTQATEKPAPAARPQPVRDIAMRVSPEAAKPVDIRLSERAGKVEVTVRTQDPELRTALQSDVGHLVERLEGDGFHTKVWTPATPASVSRMSESGNLSNDTAQDAPQHRGSQEQPGGQRRQHQGDPDIDWIEEFESNRNGGKRR